MRMNTFLGSVVLGLAGLASTAAAQAQITGAGATFPYPIYAKWAEAYKKASGVGLNYQSIGSGGGIKQIKAKTVDFGASDMPLKADDLEQSGLIQFPAVMGGVVPILNVEGVKAGQLKLSGQLLGAIYLGKVTKWNAPEIKQLNPDLNLPDSTINVVYRSDGSGTTFLFTDYLSKVSTDFKSGIGAATTVKWPTGLGGKGNEGVAANVQRIRNSIGYVEYAYAKRNNIAHAQLQNSAGKFVQPEERSFQAAAAGADWSKAPGFALVLTNPAGEESWPITGASFILMHKNQANAEKAGEILKFFDWSFKNGSTMASELDYVAMPAEVVTLIQNQWKAQIKDASGAALWK